MYFNERRREYSRGTQRCVLHKFIATTSSRLRDAEQSAVSRQASAVKWTVRKNSRGIFFGTSKMYKFASAWEPKLCALATCERLLLSPIHAPARAQRTHTHTHTNSGPTTTVMWLVPGTTACDTSFTMDEHREKRVCFSSLKINYRATRCVAHATNWVNSTAYSVVENDNGTRSAVQRSSKRRTSFQPLAVALPTPYSGFVRPILGSLPRNQRRHSAQGQSQVAVGLLCTVRREKSRRESIHFCALIQLTQSIVSGPPPQRWLLLLLPVALCGTEVAFRGCCALCGTGPSEEIPLPSPGLWLLIKTWH